MQRASYWWFGILLFNVFFVMVADGIIDKTIHIIEHVVYQLFFIASLSIQINYLVAHLLVEQRCHFNNGLCNAHLFDHMIQGILPLVKQDPADTGLTMHLHQKQISFINICRSQVHHSACAKSLIEWFGYYFVIHGFRI